MTPAAAEATDLPAGVPVVATANDKAVEALGNGLLQQSQLLLSLGTYITVMRPAGQRRPDSSAHWSNLACQPHRYLDESGGIRRGMSTISWIRDLVGVELAERAQQAGCRVEDVMNDAAGRVPPGSNGLLTVLDWLAPVDAPHRRGAMVGFDARHGWAQMYRSILEGIAMTMRLRSQAMASALDQQVTSIIVGRRIGQRPDDADRRRRLRGAGQPGKGDQRRGRRGRDLRRRGRRAPTPTSRPPRRPWCRWPTPSPPIRRP